MSRRFAAILEVDEETAKEVSRISCYGDLAPGEYLEEEFGWLKDSGITLTEWLITDFDDELRWARYINYLIDWAMSHSCEDYEGMSPACYDEWCDNEGGEIDA